MIMSIGAQIKLIVFSIAAGIITGILFDIYRIIRGYTNINKLVVFIEDILFWIFSGVTVFVFLLYTNYAYTDMYVYLWIVLGIVLYFKLASKIFSNLERKIFKILGRMFRITLNIVQYPFQCIIYYSRAKNNKNCKK
ncbi:MAG: spore cortex biosynthesis protein YabQ [Clostridium sp.]|uniref:spore cortex biosynthesis protein YabQ n=1 Tax=Clostridium sp. TaxID=1506 RepID=UPI0025BA729F|nr:spore cortex biosynthesis protein YabQ [Clostridium sp.]MCH3965625.1 spore cortex biosynthesis protein YabQ [Clostridium sp.]MCI1717134.1 spore cortex biosynthesis protein YabQ [Clostridium sp.]MCI1801461.1 spore cortex biosynthesis protein YabQ [Clostridium sp.]MCI1815320.1 spore cortex biosynthesis protein YabQ [Clostridium sp.]MCI1872210.1 spore cortex biosynthesis protein YabQ [Clostridium sp.]